MRANATTSLPHLQYVTYGAASRGFAGFQGSFLSRAVLSADL